MPNLFSALPVAILAWVLASTSGLTRTEIVRGAALAGGDRRQQLELRLGLDVDAEDALVERERKLGAVLPTPENMILSGGTPAASARLSSPSDTTSAPAPSLASVAITAWLEFAFIA